MFDETIFVSFSIDEAIIQFSTFFKVLSVNTVRVYIKQWAAVFPALREK